MKYILSITLSFISSLCFSNDFNGYWEGKFSLDGSAWPMRLHIIQSGDSVKALLDIPNLVFAREPVAATVNKDTVGIVFPFGLGNIQFTRKDDKLLPVSKKTNISFSKTVSPPYRIESITWESENATLKGSLYIPDSGVKHPLMIRLHGSGSGSRQSWEYRSWADYFARKGIATVVFDRRGEGASFSESKDVNFDDLADDVIALISEMKKRNNIDTDRIILNGGSQAAYISFIVNSKCDDVNYMILSGASSVSVIEQERQSLIFRMRTNGESRTSINEAVGYQNLYFHYVMTGKNWEVLKESAIEAQSRSWAQYTDQPQKRAHLDWWRNNYDTYQPDVMLPLVKVPTLIFFGENDAICPPSVMLPHFINYFEKANNDSFKAVICSDVGHSLEVAFGRDRWGNIIFPQRSPEMFLEIERWLDKFDLM